MSFWLNVDEQRTDWIEKVDQPTFQDSITVDKSTKRQQIASGSCPVLELRKQGNSKSPSALLTTKDCDKKAGVLCTLDLSKSTTTEKQPNLSCLRAAKTTSKHGDKTNGRRKRDKNTRIDEQAKLKIEGKISVYIIYM